MAATPLYRNEQTTVGYDQGTSDFGHIIVNCYLDDGRKATIGHIYAEVHGDEIKYISLNAKGREIFKPTTDFNSVEKQFERYAHLYKIKQNIKEKFKRPFINKKYSPFKKSNPMTTSIKSAHQKQQQENQLKFVEYEKMRGDGHFVTVVDSYRNIIGRIYKSYNDQSKKYEYVAYDHSGRLMVGKDSLWELKKEFTNNREQLLEDAHQRRIAARDKSHQEKEQTPEKTGELAQRTSEIKRRKEAQSIRSGRSAEQRQQTKQADTNLSQDQKSGAREVKEQPVDEHHSKQDEREEELSDLRDNREEERGEMER